MHASGEIVLFKAEPIPSFHEFFLLNAEIFGAVSSLDNFQTFVECSIFSVDTV